jgi:hypothetical protein
MNDTLVIIGNGFDLAHRYKTRYSDFAEKGKCTAFHDFQALQEKYLSGTNNSGKNWYEFEDIINLLTQIWFVRLNDAEETGNDVERNNILPDIHLMNRIFVVISKFLKKYIQKETNCRKTFILPSLQKELKKDCIILSFNYSDVAERYSHNINYIHGSIKENHIILGYPVRDEPDVIDDLATLFSKDKLRALLNFRRYLTQNNVNPSFIRGRILLRCYNKQIQCLSGAKGDCDDDFERLPKIIQEYLTQCNYWETTECYGYDFEKIRRLVIMGHSLMADFDVIDSILEQLKSLKEIVIYTYAGESQTELLKKQKYFSGRNITVPIAFYSY